MVAVGSPQVHRGRATKSERPSVDGREETEEGRGRGGGAAGAMVLI